MERLSYCLRAFLMVLGLISSLALMSSTALANDMLPSAITAKQQNFIATAGEFNTYPSSAVAVGGVVNLTNGVPGHAVILAGRANLGGQLERYVITSAGKINFNATAQNRALLLGGTINASPNSYMKQGGIIIGGDVKLTGEVLGDVLVVGGNVFLSGKILGNVSVIAGQLTVASNTKIFGKLDYVSASDAKISPQAKIGAGVTHLSASELNVTREETRFDLGQWILRIVQFLLAIIVINLCCKQFAPKVSDTFKASPWKNLGVGLLFVFAGALALFILIATVIGTFLAVLWGALYVLVLLVGYLYLAQSIGLSLLSLVKKEMNVWFTSLAALIGLVILALVDLIPTAGNWLTFIAVLFGVGAVVRSSLCRACSGKTACKTS